MKNILGHRQLRPAILIISLISLALAITYLFSHLQRDKGSSKVVETTTSITSNQSRWINTPVAESDTIETIETAVNNNDSQFTDQDRSIETSTQTEIIASLTDSPYQDSANIEEVNNNSQNSESLKTPTDTSSNALKNKEQINPPQPDSENGYHPQQTERANLLKNTSF